MSKELKIPENAIIDDSCIDVLRNHLCEYIIIQTKRYTDLGIDIYLHPYYFRIRHNHHIYYATVIKNEDVFYWYLKPYGNSYFTTSARDMKSFEIILQAILDNNFFRKEK